MHHELQLRIIDELREGLARRANHDAGGQMRVPTASYIDRDLAAREWDAFFGDHPQLVGLSGDLPTAGSFFTCADFGVPVLATRDASGNFRAFVNACRHRGARLVEQTRGTGARFTCPFHGWTYAADGALVAVTEAEQFGPLDKSCHGLIELPATEHLGLLWVHPRSGATIEPASLLLGLDAELASWDLARLEHTAGRTLELRMNWKLANDTFGETYHFSRLHRDTLGQLFHGDVLAYEAFGRNHRAVFPSRTISKLDQRAREEWRLDSVATVLYYLFPNVQMTVSRHLVTVFRIYPEAGDPRRSRLRVDHYYSPEALARLDDSGRTLIDEHTVYALEARDGQATISPAAQLEIVESTLEHEDLRMAEAAQRTAESGCVTHFVFGRNEAPLQHFHTSFRSALGLAPLTSAATDVPGSARPAR